MGDKPFSEDDNLRRKRAQHREEFERPRRREEPPDQAAEERSPSLNEVMHRAEALATVSPPVDAPISPMNDLGKIESMARMGGEVPVMGSGSGSGGLGPTEAGEDIGRQVDEILESIDGLTVERRREDG